MRSRAALLPTVGDPFLLTYWLDLYKARWASEVDRLYILINTDNLDNHDYLGTLTKYPNVELIIIPTQIEHGKAIDELVSRCREEYVMLIEDDAFIFNGSEIERCFSAIESGTFDLVGSKRGCTSSWLINQENQRWGINDQDIEGDTGPNFWPNFLFTNKQNLLNTDCHFGAKSWEAGENVPIVNLPAPELTASDTFVWASMQLRNMNLKIGYVKQYHAAPEDLDHHLRNYNIFDGNACWLHAGSLSSGFGSLLSDRDLPTQIAQTDMEKKEIERRIAFWSMFLDHYYSRTDIPEATLYDLAKKYADWIDRLFVAYHLDRKHVEKLKACYRELMSWT